MHKVKTKSTHNTSIGKKVPVRVNPETGERTLSWSYMFLPTAEKKLRKLKARDAWERPSLKKRLFRTGLRLVILFELLTWGAGRFFEDKTNRLRILWNYLRFWLPQQRKRGFDDRELWNLDLSLMTFIANYLEPRVRGFYRMKRCSFPTSFGSLEEWDRTLLEILEGFEILRTCGDVFSIQFHESLEGDKERISLAEKKVQRSIELFSKYWVDLWD